MTLLQYFKDLFYKRTMPTIPREMSRQGYVLHEMKRSEGVGTKDKSFHLSQTIHQLRKKGWKITTHRSKSGTWYELV